MALKWDQSERSQNFRYKVTAVSVRGLFFKFFPRCGERWQMRCRSILLITEHPIQQGIRKGGGPSFLWRGRGRTDRMAYSRQLDINIDRSCSEILQSKINENCNARFVRRRMSAIAPGLVPVWMVDFPNNLHNVTTLAKSSFTGPSGDQICKTNTNFITLTKCSISAYLVGKTPTKFMSKQHCCGSWRFTAT